MEHDTVPEVFEKPSTVTMSFTNWSWSGIASLRVSVEVQGGYSLIIHWIQSGITPTVGPKIISSGRLVNRLK